MTVEQDVQRFKMELLRKMPFYGDIVVRLSFESNYNIETACTNGLKVYYNPDFFKELAQGERYFILMHEVFHVILMHCRRGIQRDPRIWNTACDIIVNQMLTQMRTHMNVAGIPFTRPQSGIFARISGDMTTEELYEEIAAANNKLTKKQKVLVLKKDFVWNGNAASNVQEVKIPDDLDTYVVDSDGRVHGSNSSVHGSNSNANDQNSNFEEILFNEQMIKNIVREALQKNRSDVGSYYIPQQMLALTESKKLNWKTLLKNFLNQKISDEASYTTPERKYLHMDMILPGYSMTDDELEELWAFVDSSGSISQNEMNQFLTQLYRISKEFHCVINICYWDTKVTEVYRNIRSEKEILKCVPKHTGGTNINCVYQWISENKVKPDVMLILTDGAFGHLTTPDFKKKYQRQTILVISSDRYVNDEMKKIGKIATL